LTAAANDGLVFQACCRASLQINEFMPLLAHSFLGSLELLLQVNRMLAAHFKSIEADAQVCRAYLERSPMIITALLPQIGYTRAEKLLEEFRRENAAAPAGTQRLIKEFLVERLGSEAVEKALSAQALTQLGFTDGKNG
jgi:aspartate ammonia-lyase